MLDSASPQATTGRFGRLEGRAESPVVQVKG